jgi:hypothetical protein
MQNAKQYITETDEGYDLYIALDNVMCAGVTVESISMFIAKDADEGDGDLAVTWSMEGLRNDETARTAGMLLLRNIHSDDDVTRVMGDFYWEGMFTDDLRYILAEKGFTTANCVHTSEWGMQDEGRAGYDAYELADEVRSIMQNTVLA